jgi:hypothetical protein
LLNLRGNVLKSQCAEELSIEGHMGGEIIAEKFALLKTRGSNGVSFTHFVEDTLLGQRAVVKVSDKLEDLGLEYLKAINLVRESDIHGLLVPFEGGLLEEEVGYYLAFPELGEPSLENYLRMGAPLTCRDALGIAGQILHIMEDLHGAGFCHLFINTRNIFYRPRGEVTLKDAALRQDWFHPFLELAASPDFSYFSPEVMDGAQPGTEADLYALGRLVDILLEYSVDTGFSPDEETARWLAERCRAAGSGDDASSAGEIRRGLEVKMASVEKARAAVPASSHSHGVEREGAAGVQPSPHGSRSRRSYKYGKGKAASIALIMTLVLLLVCGTAAAYLLTVDGEKIPALARGGGSVAGEETAREAFLEMKGKPAAIEEAGGLEDAGDTSGASQVESVVAETPSTGDTASGGPHEVGGVDTPAAAPPAEPSPAPPVASFSLSPAEGLSPLQVYIDASASYDPDGSIVSYAWSCGGSGKSFYHVFESNVIPAVVPITLTVTDDGGHSAQSTLYVTLY